MIGQNPRFRHMSEHFIPVTAIKVFRDLIADKRILDDVERFAMLNSFNNQEQISLLAI